ncbi:MAG: efflux RND transporter permease subunit [Myxococcales bacterium]|nr:efflux RND transporter permease subunit [Myxococcales bacterium]
MKIAEVSIGRPVFAAALNLVLLLFGAVTYSGIGVDLFPQVDLPVVTVTAIYPGADPAAVETKVADKLEEELNTLSGVDLLRSVSLENVAQVIVTFDLDRDVDQAAQDVRDKVAKVQASLPEDVDPPVVEKFDVGAAPILSVAVAGPMSPREVSRVADDVIKARLVRISGVGSVELVGRRDREIHVWVDRERLGSYGLAVTDVAQALMAQNLEVPSGRIQVGPEELMVKTKGEVDSAEAIGDLVVTNFGGAPIRVRDVAVVEDGEEEARASSDVDGTSAVALVIQKQSDANTVEVAKAVKAELEKIRQKLPEGMTLSVPSDNSRFIEASINDVKFDLLFGGILTVLIVFLFLRDLRATVIAAVALPTSVVATFAFIAVMGFTFNNMTMLALTLSIGILIDDAIVVIENIHRHLEMGKSAVQAARDATNEIGLAVMAITASIIAVFVPVALMDGIVGRFFFQFGMTVSFAVAVSLLVSFTLTPMLSSRFLKLSHGTNPLFGAVESVLKAVERAYVVTLRLAINNRLATLGVATLAFVGAVGLLKFVQVEFLPPEDNGEINVTFELPAGRTLDESKRFAELLAEDLQTLPALKELFTTIGAGADGQVNKGQIHIGLEDKQHRNFTTAEAMVYVRALLGQRPPARISVERVGAISGGGNRPQTVQYNLRGADFDEVRATADAMVEKLKATPGFVDVDTTYRGGKPEVAVTVDRARAAELGVPVAIIAQSLRTLVAGEKVTDIPEGTDRVDVLLRLSDQERRSIEDLSRIKVRSTNGTLVELSNLVSMERGTGPARIERQDRQRQITILANLEGKTLGTAMKDVEAAAKELVPEDVVRDWAGMGDTSNDSFAAMLSALVLAIGLIYLLLASQFDSIVHPFTIMLSLPLSFVGAFGALFLANATLNIFSMIGLIMLMGLVTKNAVLLVDYTATLRREEGLDIKAALLRAGPVRLRPILMTSFAMIFGMIPVALGRSLGGETRAPMAIAVIGGLISSTALSLVLVPVVYMLLDRLTVAGRRGYKAKTPEPELAADH